MSDNNDLGIVKQPGDATATMAHPHDDLGLEADHGTTAGNDLGVERDFTTQQYKKDVEDLGVLSEHGDIFQAPKEEWYSPAVRGMQNAADEFMGYFKKQSPMGIAQRIAKPGEDVTSTRQEAEAQDNPALAFLGEAAGSAATFGAAAAIPQVGLPVAFGAASVLSGVAEQGDQIKDANAQLSLGQRIGKIGVDAVAGAITGKIFQTASKGATVLDRVLERSGGAGATAITQSIANEAVEGKEPDVGRAVAAGGMQAVAIGIVGAMVEVPQLRGLVMDQARALVDKDGNVMGSTGPYKVDPDNITIDQAKKILGDATINPESLAPEFQKAQYDIKRQMAMENLDKKAKQYGVDHDVMADVLNAQDQRARETILTRWMADKVKTDPKTAQKLLPFFDAIKQGADPVDILIMSDMLDKFKASTKMEQTLEGTDENAAPGKAAPVQPVAEASKEPSAAPAREAQPGAELPRSEGAAQAGAGAVAASQAVPAGPAAGVGPSQESDRTVVNDQIKTQSGRMIPVPPEIRTDTERKAKSDLKSHDQWLIDQVKAEAQSKKDDYNLVWINQMKAGHLSQADKDISNEYLFGETDPKFNKPGQEPAAAQVNPTVPKEGELVGPVYHGTMNEFDKFDLNFLGSNTGAPSAKQGFFFSPQKEVAQSYVSKRARGGVKLHSKLTQNDTAIQELTGDNWIQASHKMVQENLFQRPSGYSPEVKEKLNKLLDQRQSMERAQGDLEDTYFNDTQEPIKGAHVMERYLQMKNPLVVDMKGDSSRPESYAKIVKDAKAKGHDSVIIKNTYDAADAVGNAAPHDVHVVFRTEQIKTTEDVAKGAEINELGMVKEPEQPQQEPAAPAPVEEGQPQLIKDMVDYFSRSGPLSRTPLNSRSWSRLFLASMRKNIMTKFTTLLKWE